MQPSVSTVGPSGRRYDASVEVRRRDEAPVEFLWRGRLHVVRAVLARWVETGRWWDASLETPGPDDGECELWRVEAGAGAAAGTGVYDLRFDWASGRWTIARVLD